MDHGEAGLHWLDVERAAHLTTSPGAGAAGTPALTWS
jgi:hypothetical protein